ncbi:hypothetical protein N0V90_012909 [Kalmusia sp. IMI 367209]|nr:hypothetical protein N0V90_012909 [Kalmusia sp. IMI 367209]
MLLSLAVALGGTVSLAASHQSRHVRRAVASFPAGATWDILLNKGDIDLNDLGGTSSADVSAIDIDLFDNDASIISNLKSQNKQVICYFSAGSREDWREDASKFNADDYGQGLEGWEGENWVNVKSDNVKSIMKARIALAAQKGCTAVDPDNVDGFGDNQDGFGYDQSAYSDYVKFLASEASAQNLAIGLKNALDLIPDVVDVIQFAVNEQCHEYDECDRYKPLTDANKAVFNIEYGGDACSSPAGVKLSVLIKPEDQGLNTLGGACEAGANDAGGAASPSAASSSASAQTGIGKSTSVPVPVQTASLQTAPSVTQTKASSTAAAAAPEPTSEGDDEDEDDEDEDEEDDEEEDDEDDEDEEEEAEPWYKTHHQARPQ